MRAEFEKVRNSGNIIDKLVFVGLMERNTFPRGEGAPKGRMRNGET